MIWRGAVAHPPFLTGRSMLIAGGMQAKLVLYPIAHQTSTPGTNLLNWAVTAKLGDGSAPPPRREDWNRLGRLDELLPHVEGVFHLHPSIPSRSSVPRRKSTNIPCAIVIPSRAGHSAA